MKKTKMEKGITLIALIITIVVLLILAMVTIGAIKDSKIIEHAQTAKDEYVKAQENEQLQLALSEWQIQKNIPGNENRFKEIISEALGDNATVSENDDGTLTITFETDNKYQITKDGEIEETYKLEKLILGEDLQGRDLSEIMDINEEYFYNEDMEYLTARNEGFDDNGAISIIYYIKYNNNTYRFKAIYGEEKIYKTDPSYGIIGINVTGKKVGKKVSYDGKIWTILYDDATNGLQMISNEVYDNFYLGRNDSSITNWNSLITTADLDGNGSLNDLEKSIYSYNNAITTLNTACENLFKENGNYKNSNIVDVRCVGSNPTSKNSENATPYTSENLAKWPVGSTKYKSGIADEKCKSEDLNYETDFDRMVALGINIGYDDSNEGKTYWLASRFVTDIGVYFNMRYVQDDGWSNYYILCYITKNNATHGGDGKNLRPVVKLDKSVVFSGDGTSDSPYTF